MHGLQPIGELNQATVASLGLDPDALLGASAVAAAVPPVVPPYPPALSVHAVEMVQEQLRRLGYCRGAIDGAWGLATQDAIVSFQQGRGLQPNGELNTATVAALGLNPSYVFAA